MTRDCMRVKLGKLGNGKGAFISYQDPCSLHPLLLGVWDTFDRAEAHGWDNACNHHGPHCGHRCEYSFPWWGHSSHREMEQVLYGEALGPQCKPMN